MVLHFFFFFPETSGKTLEQVEDMFARKVKPWNTRVERRLELTDAEEAGTPSDVQSDKDIETKDATTANHMETAAA